MAAFSFDDIEHTLGERHLYIALKALEPYARNNGDYHYVELLQNIEENYGFLLSYFTQGNDDAHRDEVLRSLYVTAFQIADDLRTLTGKDGAELSAMKLKARDFHPTEPTEDHPFSQLKYIFYSTWLQTQSWEAELQNFSEEQLAMWSSGALLNLMHHFSESLFILMIEAAVTPLPMARQRLLTGILLLYLRYYNRLSFFPSIEKAINSLLRKENIKNDMQHICRCLVNTHLTPQVQKAMKALENDIRPTIERKTENGEFKHIVINIEESDDDGNPEWQTNLTDGMPETFSQHLDEIAHLHQLGGDSNYATTLSLLDHPFFTKDIANWFMPFSEHNPELGVDFTTDRGKFIKNILVANREGSEIDKHGICCMYSKLASNLSLENLTKSIEGMEEMTEQLKDFELPPTDWALTYVRDLYRFFNNNPWHLPNLLPFADGMADTELFDTIFKDEEREDFGNHCLALKLYAIAEKVFVGDSIIALQKRGFSLQKQGQYEEAYELYQRVLLIEDSEWTLHHAAICSRHLGRTKEALIAYEQLSEEYPDKAVYLRQLAQCHLQLHQYEQALQTFYKLDILFPDNQSKRGIGWCAFLCNKTELAETYLEQLAFQDDATDNDLMNYAHLLLSTGHREEALKMYMRVAEQQNKVTDFIKLLRADRELLLQKNVSPVDFSLTEDAIVAMATEKRNTAKS